MRRSAKKHKNLIKWKNEIEVSKEAKRKQELVKTKLILSFLLFKLLNYQHKGNQTKRNQTKKETESGEKGKRWTAKKEQDTLYKDCGAKVCKTGEPLESRKPLVCITFFYWKFYMGLSLPYTE